MKLAPSASPVRYSQTAWINRLSVGPQPTSRGLGVCRGSGPPWRYNLPSEPRESLLSNCFHNVDLPLGLA